MLNTSDLSVLAIGVLGLNNKTESLIFLNCLISSGVGSTKVVELTSFFLENP